MCVDNIEVGSTILLFLCTAVRKRKHAQQIVINGCQRGLGIRVVGGRNVASDLEKDFGIFIKQILPGSLAAQDGKG